MAKLSQLPLMSIMAAVFAVSACTTEDPRTSGEFPNAGLPRGLGEVCDPDADPPLTCATGLTCYEFREGLPSSCTPDAFAAACTPNPCGENGLCNARGEDDVLAFCRCDGGFQWDGQTCIMAPGPDFPDSLTETTCPAEELAPGVPDEDTADCPAGDTIICTASSGGDCLEYTAGLMGEVGGTMFGAVVTGADAASLAECSRKYIDPAQLDEDEDPGESTGITLTITGTLAGQLIDGATEVVIDVSNVDVLSQGSFVVWPQMSAPEPEGDAGFVNVTVTGALNDFSAAAIGGEFNLNFASGDDVIPMGATEDDPDGDGILDDSTGDVGVDFIFGFDGGDIISGAFVTDCGNNTLVDPPPDM